MAHTYRKTNIKFSTLLVVTIFSMLLLGTLNAANSSISRLGFLSLASALGITNIISLIRYFKTQKINKTHALLIAFSFTFIAISFISSLNNFSSEALTNIGQFILCIGLVVFLSTIEWNRIKIKITGNLASLFILIQFSIWAVNGFPQSFSSIYANPNLIGPYMLFTMFFVILAIKTTKKWIYLPIIFLGLLVMLGSDARSALFAGLIALIIYFIWKPITSSKKVFVLFFLIVVTILLSFVFLYPKLPEWEHFYYFESLMLEYTGKSLMSGRNVIWTIITDVINQQPWFGYGSGASASSVTHLNASTHNLYLQIALQNGYLGLSVFLILLFTMWMTFWKNKNNITVRLSASFFIAILIHQSFEIALTQYQLSIGLIQWTIIAVGLGISLRNASD